MTRITALVLAVAVSLPNSIHAQAPTGERSSVSGANSPCSYAACALAIVPRWNGLAAIRGTNGPRVTNLNFFWPRSVTAALRDGASDRGADSTAAHAERALGLRRAGAAFTDLGLVAAAIVGGRAASRGRMLRGEKIAAGAAAASLALSVPLQFAADGELSRAVWWHNVRFAH